MRKLYEIFKVLKIQKRIVSPETIRGNTVYINFQKFQQCRAIYQAAIDYSKISDSQETPFV